MTNVQSSEDVFWTESIIEYFYKFGKDISHLSHEEINEKSKEVAEECKRAGIDVNNGDAYLQVVYTIFGV